ncbi:MAG: DUF4271 domain-containing protein [Cytophagales bacterium]|nr:DUF4271 domain-containing protein [Cytophagales bacterium]
MAKTEGSILGWAKILLVGWVLVQALVAEALPPMQYKTVQNLEDQWLHYDEKYKGYVPYFRNEHGVQSALSLHVDLNDYPRYQILLQTPLPSHLFVQSQLCRALPAQGSVVLDVDSLRRRFKSGPVLITLFTPQGYTTLPVAQVVYGTPAASKADGKPVVAPVAVTGPRLRELPHFRDFAVLAMLFLVVFHTFLLQYHPKAFQRNFNLQGALRYDLREDTSLVAKPLSQINLLFIFAHSLSLSFFYMMAQRHSGTRFVNILPTDFSDSFNALVTYFALCTVVVFGLLIVKYVFIYVTGVVFGVDKAAPVHYYEYLLFSRAFFLFVVPLQFVLMVSQPEWLAWLMPVTFAAILVLNVIRTLVIGAVLNKTVPFRNLYLFSYLCATELIPLLIGMKFLVK